jgi:predicted nucleic-acid-binding Zn-ribbon protein
MNDNISIFPVHTCPKCGLAFTGIPALSREDNTTLICPDCGIREALASIGIGMEETEKILKIIHKYT